MTRMSDTEFQLWAYRLGLSQEAIEVIQDIRTSEPSRRVQAFAGNTTVQYASDLMECSLQAESRTVELPKLIDLHNDPDVLEIYDQPRTFYITYISKSGRKLPPIPVTADYFVIRRNSAGWIECKAEEELEKRAAKMPNRYVRDTSGRWQALPETEYAQRLGLTFEICSSADYPWIFIRNCEFLADYLRDNASQVTPESRDAILERIRRNPGISLEELFCENSDEFTSDDVYYLIAHREIYVDLYSQPVPELDLVQLFINSDLADAYKNVKNGITVTRPPHVKIDLGTILIYDERRYIVKLAGAQRITLSSDDQGKEQDPKNSHIKDPKNPHIIEFDREELHALITRGSITVFQTLPTPDEIEIEIREILAHLSPGHAAETNRKCEVVEAALCGELISDDKPRTVRHWKRCYRLALERYGSGYYGLVPKHYLKGNRRPRPPQISIDLAIIFIEAYHRTFDQRTIRSVWIRYQNACKSATDVNQIIEAAKSGTIKLLEWEPTPLPPEEKQGSGTRVISYPTFCKMVGKRYSYEYEKDRKGKRGAYPLKPPFYINRGTPIHGDYAWQYGYIDWTQINLETLHPLYGISLGRPYLTLLTLGKTRLCLVPLLSYDRSNFQTFMLVARACVRRYGRLPDTFIVDGGKEYASTYVDTLLKIYSKHKLTRSPGESHSGSVSENLFGVSEVQLVHQCVANTQQMKDVRTVTKSNNPKNRALWTFNLFEKRLNEWVDRHNRISQNILGMSPLEAQEIDLALNGKRQNSIIPYDDNFYCLTLPQTKTKKGTAKIQTMGVKINGIYYHNDALDNYLGHDVPVRYDPYNWGVAYAYVNHTWIECHSKYYTQLEYRSERQIAIATERIKQGHVAFLKSKDTTEESLAALFANIEEDEALLAEINTQADKDAMLRFAYGDLFQLPSQISKKPIPSTSITAPSTPENTRTLMPETGSLSNTSSDVDELASELFIPSDDILPEF